MSSVSGIARRALRGVADAIAQGVGRNELFEQPGERPKQAPVFGAKAAGVAQSSPARAEAKAAAAPQTAKAIGAPARLTDTEGFLASLRSGRVQVVNHWATWCIPCVEEFPHLKALATQLPPGVALVGLSWDLFDPRGDEDDIREHVENFGNGHHLTWPSQVLKGSVVAEDFFEALSLSFQQIPQTWVVNGKGEVTHRVDGVLREVDIPALLEAVAAAGGAS